MRLVTMCFVVLLFASILSISRAQVPGKIWERHTIDASSKGADGVKLADADGDGRLDIVTGWEEGSVIRVTLHPGYEKVRQPWPGVTVGEVKKPEDAVFVDLDGDGALDVVSSCEGKLQSMFVHWAPKDKAKYLDASAWQTKPIPATQGVSRWMFCEPIQMDGQRGVDLVAASKAPGAQVCWLESPDDPRNLAAWKLHKITDAGWIMSVFTIDMDADGDLDVLITDRKGPARGCRWLENPGPGAKQSGPWRSHMVHTAECQFMFLRPTDLNKDGLVDLLVAVKPKAVLYLQRKDAKGDAWQCFTIPFPEQGTGTAKGVNAGDLDRDGLPDIVLTCEHADKGTSGAFWLKNMGPLANPEFKPQEMGGPQGVKFDRIELLDMDGDEDLDVLTCEERDNLGVFWYENPAIIARGFPRPTQRHSEEPR